VADDDWMPFDQPLSRACISLSAPDGRFFRGLAVFNLQYAAGGVINRRGLVGAMAGIDQETAGGALKIAAYQEKPPHRPPRRREPAQPSHLQLYWLKTTVIAGL